MAYLRDLVSLAPARRSRRRLRRPAHDRLADIIYALATTLTSQLAHQETGALPLTRTALSGAK